MAADTNYAVGLRHHALLLGLVFLGCVVPCALLIAADIAPPLIVFVVAFLGAAAVPWLLNGSARRRATLQEFKPPMPVAAASSGRRSRHSVTFVLLGRFVEGMAVFGGIIILLYPFCFWLFGWPTIRDEDAISLLYSFFIVVSVLVLIFIASLFVLRRRTIQNKTTADEEASAIELMRRRK
jgi:hypothetical protein